MTSLRKRLFSFLTLLLFVIPGLAQAVDIRGAEDFTPGNALFTADFSLTGKLKTSLEAEIRDFFAEEKSFETEANAKKLAVLESKLLNGSRFFVSYVDNGLLLSFPVSDSDWTILTAETEKHTYEGVDVFQEMDTEEGYMAKISGFAVMTFSANTDLMHKVIDFANGKASDSLDANTKYQSMISSYFSPHLASATIDIPGIMKALFEYASGVASSSIDGYAADPGAVDLVVQEKLDAITALFDIFQFEGGSFAETATGYKFNFKVTGNAQKLTEKSYSLNPGGNFIPSLYTKFPNAKPILYFESFNYKADFDQSEKFNQSLMNALGFPEDVASGLDTFSMLKNETGFDFNSVATLLDKEMAVAVQYENGKPFPYVTLLANVSAANRPAAQTLMKDTAQAIVDALSVDEVSAGAVTSTWENGFSKITIDLTKVDDDETIPPFPEITLTLGVTSEGLLVASNYPGIDKVEKRTGFGNDVDFAMFGDQVRESSAGVFYASPRNLWGWLDSATAWIETVSGGRFAPPLDFYNDYYSMLQSIYTWKDLFFISRGSAAEMTVTGTVTIDNAKHTTYEEFITALKSRDPDSDGMNDYEERYIYYTPTDTADADGDGVSDLQEIVLGSNPEGPGRFFSDVPEDTYYTDEVGFLRQRKAIAGYPDGTYGGGKLMNRAEFTAAVMSAFGEENTEYLGLNFNSGFGYRYEPFSDVQPTDWFYESTAKAYNAGIVSGSVDPRSIGTSATFIFRPGDNITRGEAVAILNKASKALRKTRDSNICLIRSSFNDVQQTDWFCDAAENALKQGVATGKEPGYFKPYDNLTRAEAAVMIRRVLEKDLEITARSADSFGDVLKPEAEELLPF